MPACRSWTGPTADSVIVGGKSVTKMSWPAVAGQDLQRALPKRGGEGRGGGGKRLRMTMPEARMLWPAVAGQDLQLALS